MYGEDPSAFQGQYEHQQRQQDGGRQSEGGQQRQGTQQTRQPQGQQYSGGGTGGQQRSTQQGTQGYQQYGTQRTQGQQGRQSQQGRQHQQGMQSQRGGQFGQQGTQSRQGMQGQRGMQGRSETGQQGMSQRGGQFGQQGGQFGQQGTQSRQGMQGQQGTQRGMGQQGMQSRQGMQGQQGMQGGGTQAGTTGQQVGTIPSTRGVEMQSVTLEEVSRSEVVTVEPDEAITNVVVEMADKDVGSVVVEDDEPKGVLTDRKIALSLGEMPDVADRTAGELISGDLVTGTPGMSVYDAVRKMREEGIRRLPILDGEGQLDGIVSLDDIIVLIAGELGAAAEVIEQQAPPR